MIFLALHSADGIALFIAGMLLHLIQFLVMISCHSVLAISVWLATFISDIALMHSLRRTQAKVKNDRLSNQVVLAFSGDFEPHYMNIQSIIKVYLKCNARNMSAEFTAKALDWLLPANRYLRHPEVLLRSSRQFVWHFWEVLATVAMQIPHNHALQQRLVDLVTALAKRPAVIVRSGNELLRFWNGMPEYRLFAACFGNMAFCSNALTNKGFNPVSMMRNNLMAFFARIQGTGLLDSVHSLCYFSVSQALDFNHLDKLQWAAFWIQYCGEQIWYDTSQPTFHSQHVLGREGWARWMQQFYQIATNGQNTRQTRLLAHDSFQTMSRLTNSMPNPKFDDCLQLQWERELLLKGPDGDFAEPFAPDTRADEEPGDDDDESYEQGDPLRPAGGFLPYAKITPEIENQIARAA